MKSSWASIVKNDNDKKPDTIIQEQEIGSRATTIPFPNLQDIFCALEILQAVALFFQKS
jgi:hypothetical protein